MPACRSHRVRGAEATCLDAVTTQQLAIVELAAKSKLMLGSIEAWLMKELSLVNAREKSLLPVVRERQQLADSLARYMGQLGLERRVKPTPSFHQYLAGQAGKVG